MKNIEVIKKNKRQVLRLQEMDILFTLVRKQKKQLKIVNETYQLYKQELVNIQKNLIKCQKLI